MGMVLPKLCTPPSPAASSGEGGAPRTLLNFPEGNVFPLLLLCPASG